MFYHSHVIFLKRPISEQPCSLACMFAPAPPCSEGYMLSLKIFLRKIFKLNIPDLEPEGEWKWLSCLSLVRDTSDELC